MLNSLVPLLFCITYTESTIMDALEKNLRSEHAILMLVSRKTERI
jgi:hypothetical protein